MGRGGEGRGDFRYVFDGWVWPYICWVTCLYSKRVSKTRTFMVAVVTSENGRRKKKGVQS